MVFTYSYVLKALKMEQGLNFTYLLCLTHSYGNIYNYVNVVDKERWEILNSVMNKKM